MTTTKGSKNYVWDTQDSLGHGATSMVYQGRCKKTFDLVAVKVFNPASYNRPISIQMREFDVMKKLNHKNVVKLLSIEEENHTYNKVIVMEYCPHGSLFSMLEEPQNAFGIAEEEVLLVLQHVARGMKHLRDNAVVHRDVKPGNILRSKDPDGRSVYKLTDFGAARELEDEEHFVSLYGTEEYLHPHIYERAVLRRSNSKLFDASVDLWSIGVTYYHMATGNLPFRPFGGRRNKELMHEIVSKKEKGVISGVQSVENGAIQWSQTLPNTCQISSGLKMFLVPLLAALLEIKAEEIWSFEKYFETVDDICNKCIVNLFCPMQSQHLKIYLDPNENLFSLQECVAMEAKITQENQVLLVDSQPLEIVIDTTLPIKNYPDYISYHNPVLIFNKEDKFSPYPDPVYIAPFPKVPEGIQCNNEMDYRTARLCCKIAHAVLIATGNIVHSNVMLHHSVKHYSHELSQGIELQNGTMKHVTQFCQTTNIWFAHFLKTMKFQLTSLCLLQQKHDIPTLQHLVTNIDNMLTEAQEKFETTSKEIEEEIDFLNKGMEKITSNDTDTKQLPPEWNTSLGCLPISRCTDFLSELIIKLQKSTTTLKNDRFKRGLSHNEEQIHKYERCEVKKITDDIRIRLTTHCCPAAHDLYSAFKTWYSQAVKNRQLSLEMKSKMNNLIQKQSAYYQLFNLYLQQYHELLSEKLTQIQTEGDSLNKSTDCFSRNSNDSNLGLRRQVAGDILQGLKTSRNSVEEMVQLVKENTSIIERFESLSLPEDCGRIT